MKTFKSIILSALIVILFYIPASAQDKTIVKSVNNVINSYLSLKDALAAGNGNSAELKAKDLLTSIKQVPEKSMDKKQLSLWTAYAAKLQFDSRHISEVKILGHQREHFASLSNNLYALLKGLKLNNAMLYRQYCEMKHQYFISESATGTDPYMGMANCSKVKEVLPPAK